MRIAHLSDLHCDSTRSSTSKIRGLFHQVQRTKPDHIVITGDLTHHGDEDEFAALQDLVEEQGWNRADRLTVIPGNHDMFPEFFGVRDWEDVLEGVDPQQLPALIKDAFLTLQRFCNYNRSNYIQAMRNFRQAFGATFEGMTNIGSKTYPFPSIKIVGEDVALICLDSNYVFPTIDHSPLAMLKGGVRRVLGNRDWISEAYEHSDNPLCCNGWVDIEKAQKALRHPIVRGKKKIVLLHHYFYHREDALKYADPAFVYFMRILPASLRPLLGEMVASHVDLVLHGHWHVTEEYSRNSLRILNGGAALGTGKWFLITCNSKGFRIRKSKRPCNSL